MRSPGKPETVEPPGMTVEPPSASEAVSQPHARGSQEAMESPCRLETVDLLVSPEIVPPLQVSG